MARPGCVRSRRLRIPKYPAVTLWLCTVAAPSTALQKYQCIQCTLFLSAQGGGRRRCGASLTDDNAAMAEIAGAVCTDISAMLYQLASGYRRKLKVPLGCAPGCLAGY